MALVTIQVLDGADRGRVFEDLPTPVTIGREEGNSVQLNDERVSRFHLKLQEDDDKIVLTDLESTNGTKVNGEAVQLWILRPGDLVALGRTLILFGSREEIARRLAALRGVDLSPGVPLDSEEMEQCTPGFSLDEELAWTEDPDARAVLHTLLPPELPGGLGPGLAAQFCEAFQYLHLRLRALVQSVKVVSKSDRVTLDARQWQNLLDLQGRLGAYVRAMSEPGEKEP